MEKFMIAFFSSLAGYLTVIAVYMLGTTIYKVVKEIYENKTKLRIFFNHIYFINNNNEISWNRGMEEVKLKVAQKFISINLKNFSVSDLKKIGIDLENKKNLKENYDKIGDIFSEDRLISFLKTSIFRNLLKENHIPYYEFTHYIEELNAKGYNITDKLYKINDFLEEKVNKTSKLMEK